MKTRWQLLLFVGLVLLLIGLVIGCSESYYKVNLDADYYEGYYRGYFTGFSEGQNHILDWKVFTDDYTYYILLPPEWSVSEGRSGGTFIESPKDSAYVTVGPDYQHKSINESVDAAIGFIKNSEFTSNFSLISDKKIKHHGLKARVVEYTWEDSLSASRIRYCKILTVMAGDGLHEARFYVWQEHYSSFESTIDRVLDSYHPLWDLRAIQ